MKAILKIIYLGLVCLTIHAKKPAFKPFVLPQLPYAECALEPFIDTETMHLHHKKHHQKSVSYTHLTLPTNREV